MSLRLIGATLALAVLAFAARPLAAHDVVVFGDSWAAGGADELATVLANNGHAEFTVDGQGVAGTTAELWATQQPDALPVAVSLNPDARWVWLSIGGNDVFGHYAAGNGANAAADNDLHIRTMLDRLFAAHPGVKVVMFGYDFVNFEQSTECIQQAWLVFGVGTLTPTINQIFLDAIAAVQAGIAADYPNVTYVPSVWGTLQAAGGVAGAPNVLFPSPAAYMSDCIHPNHQGYLRVLQALYDGYWGRPAPSAGISRPPGPHCVGAVVPLSDASSGATARRWTLDGADAGGAASIDVVLADAGSHTVTLTAIGGAWDDTTNATVTAEAPLVVTLSGPFEVAAGAVETYAATLGAAAYDWDVSGGTLEATNGPQATVRWGSEGEGRIAVATRSAAGCEAGAARPVVVRAGTCGAGLPDGAPCDDGDPCTSGDACQGDVCVGAQLACDDGDPCTESRCEAGECVVVGLAPGCCETHDDCGLFDACAVDGRCHAVLCAPCGADSDCGRPGDRCLALPSGGACGVDCGGPVGGCPPEFVCAAIGEDRQCVPAAGDCECAPEFARACRGGALVWLDSCGRPGAAITDCAGRGCVDDVCCPAGTEERDGACESEGVADPAPDVVEPAPDVVESAPDAVNPAPDAGESPDVAEPAPDAAGPPEVEGPPDGADPEVDVAGPPFDGGGSDPDVAPAGPDGAAQDVSGGALPDGLGEDATGSTGAGAGTSGCAVSMPCRRPAGGVLLLFLAGVALAIRSWAGKRKRKRTSDGAPGGAASSAARAGSGS